MHHLILLMFTLLLATMTSVSWQYGLPQFSVLFVIGYLFWVVGILSELERLKE